MHDRLCRFFSGASVGMTDLMVWPWVERLGCPDIIVPGCGFKVLPFTYLKEMFVNQNCFTL